MKLCLGRRFHPVTDERGHVMRFDHLRSGRAGLLLRSPAQELAPGAFNQPELQGLVEDMIDTMADYVGVGLAALLQKYLNVHLDKKFQRADWSARPLSAPMLAYAATDTHHLAELRDILSDRLRASGRLAWAEEEFRLLEGVRWTPREDSELDILRIKGARALLCRSLAILRELYRWRDDTARKRDKAAFRILNNQEFFRRNLNSC